MGIRPIHTPVQCIDAFYVPKEGADLFWRQQPRGVDDLQEVVLRGERGSEPGLSWLHPVFPTHPAPSTPQFCAAFYSYDTISLTAPTGLGWTVSTQNFMPTWHLEYNLRGSLQMSLAKALKMM